MVIMPSCSSSSLAKEIYRYSYRRQSWSRGTSCPYENGGWMTLTYYYDPATNPLNYLTCLVGRDLNGRERKYAGWYVACGDSWIFDPYTNFRYRIFGSFTTAGKAWYMGNYWKGVIALVSKIRGGTVEVIDTIYLGRNTNFEEPIEPSGGQCLINNLIIKKGKNLQLPIKEGEEYYLYDVNGKLISKLPLEKEVTIKNSGIYFLFNKEKKIKMIVK